MSFGKLSSDEKLDINLSMMKFPDSGRFKALNTTSEKAMGVSIYAGAPIMGARIKNMPKAMQ